MLYNKGMNNEPQDTSLEDELVFNCQGSSIDEVYGGLNDEDDIDECEEDDYNNKD